MTDIFTTFVAEAVRDFPQLKDWLVVVDVTTGQRAGNIDLERMGAKDGKELQTLLDECAESAIKKKTGLVLGPIKDKPAIICYNKPMSITASDEYNTMAELDHELGHIVVRNAIDPFTTNAAENFKECAADVFCVLRHIQRYGDDTGFIDRLIWKRAMDFMQTGGDRHFTTFALQDMKPLLEKMDVMSMTAQDLADVSWKIATRFSLQEKPADKLKTVFNDVAKDCTLPETLQKIAQITCADDADYYIARAGLAAVKPYLETGVTLKGAKIDLSGDAWAALRETMKEKESQLASDAILFNVPKTKKASGCHPRP